MNDNSEDGASPDSEALTPALHSAYPHLDATQRWERWRSACTGLVGPIRTLGLVVAVQYFHMNAANEGVAGRIKVGVLAGAMSVGLLLSPLIANLVSRMRARVTRAAAVMYALAAVGLLISGLLPDKDFFFYGVVLGVAMFSGSMPLITALWRQNVPDHLRGRFFSRVSVLGAAAGVMASLAVSAYIKTEPGLYPGVLTVMACAMVAAAFFIVRVPSEPLRKVGRNPLASLSYLWRDPLFGYLSFAWMLMGFSNLTTIPLRVVYVSDPEYGLVYSAAMILVLVDVIPGVMRVLSMQFWGRCFDSMNFMVLRILLNSCFAVSITLFFFPYLWCQVASSVLIGIGHGGGEVAWNLWVTKFSPKDRTAEYMSVHTFLTGLRGLVGPVLAMQIVAGLGIQTIAWSCSGMVLISCALLGFVIPLGRRAMPTA